MRFEFQCPWCGCDSSMRGSDKTAWRAQVPCELCSRDMVVSFERGTLDTRRGEGSTLRTDETVRIRLGRVG